MRLTLITIILSTLGLNAMASSDCRIDDYMKSEDGKEKIASLIERSKSLALSKLEEVGIEEDQVKIKAVIPKSLNDLKSDFVIQISSKTHQAENSKLIFSKVIRDEDCGLEISIQGGNLVGRENGKNFGSLGRVKEFIRL